jgi:hypothetical protein
MLVDGTVRDPRNWSLAADSAAVLTKIIWPPQRVARKRGMGAESLLTSALRRVKLARVTKIATH